MSPDPLLAAYLLVEPLVAGKVVLEIAPHPAGGEERLRRAGARDVLRETGPRLSCPDGSVDVVLCLARLAASPDDVERQAWLAELRRVLRAEGFALVRLAAGPGGARGAEELLRRHFATVEAVAEARLEGVSFSVPSVDDVAMNEALSPVAGEPSHYVVFCTAARHVVWQLPESLLVPVGTGAGSASAAELAALRAEVAALTDRHRAACAERDGLREQAMTLRDQADRREEALSALRREVDRHLRQLSDAAAAAELAHLERDRAARRAASAEHALESLAAEVQRLRAEVAALDRELARLRAAPAAARGPAG